MELIRPNEILRDGDVGDAVEQLQRALIVAGYLPANEDEDDGWFGERTEDAVRAYQRDHDLVTDGLAGPQTRAALAGRPMPGTLRQSDLAAAARTLGVDLASIMAVTEVEARNDGFIGSKPIILYERHVMYRRLEERGFDAATLAREHPGLVNRRYGGYRGGTAEHVRLKAAQRIDNVSALESCSWGLFQIMAYHAQRIGYASVEQFVERMYTSEADQLAAFVAFVQADKGSMLADLRAGRWASFARAYNGPAYARNDYDTRLAAAERRHCRLLARAA